MSEIPAVERFVSGSGVRIYRISGEAFPGLVGHIYLVLEAGPPTLVDTGSGYAQCTDQLLAGLEAVRTDFAEPVSLTDIRRILLTHGHIDHIGGLAHLQARTGAQVGIHALDRRNVTAYEERVVVTTKLLRVYLEQAGVEPDTQTALMAMYGFFKKNVHSSSVDFVLVDGQEIDGIRVIHTPGHCPGQICLAVGDVLLSSDHILPQTTPHQAPESITAYTGLGHYFESLEKVRRISGLRLTLGGHEEPIYDIYRRIDEIRSSHMQKLEKLLSIIRQAPQPPTINDISQTMYPDVGGFHQLLAVEEVGAHVEYLYQHGQLAVTNLDQLEREPNPALRYRPV
jgi:glyoxylase-like metal-dependent hydrolase (beta-lactamase superfamily II)